MKWRAAARLIRVFVRRSKTRGLLFRAFAPEPPLCYVVLPISGARDRLIAINADGVGIAVNAHEHTAVHICWLKFLGAETFFEGRRAHTPSCSTRRARNTAGRCIPRRVRIRAALFATKTARRGLRVARRACYTSRSGRIQKLTRGARPTIARALHRDVSRGTLFAGSAIFAIGPSGTILALFPQLYLLLSAAASRAA